VNKKWMKAGGVLNIVSAAFYAALGVFYIILAVSMSSTALRMTMIMTSVWVFIPAAVSIVGGIYALKSKNWKLAFAGSILALGVPLLGMAAGILLIKARGDWSKTRRGVVWGVISFLGFLSILCWLFLIGISQ
jgi:hypothetical protein